MANPTSLGSTATLTNDTTVAVASVSPAANSLVLCWCYTKYTGGTGPDITDDFAGGLGSWTQFDYSAATNNYKHCFAWSKASASPGTGTITATVGANTRGKQIYVAYVSSGDFDTTTPLVANPDTAEQDGAGGTTFSVTLSSSPTGMVIGFVGAVRVSSGNIVEGTDFTELIEDASGVGPSDVNGEVEYDAASPVDTTIDWSGFHNSNTSKYYAIGLEIKPVGAAGNPWYFYANQ
jgi:hypothetical protein